MVEAREALHATVHGDAKSWTWLSNWITTIYSQKSVSSAAQSCSCSLLKLMSTQLVMSSNYLILCHPLLLPPSIFPSIRPFLMSQFFASGGQSIGASRSVLPMNIQGWFHLWFVWSPCSPWDSQESSPTPQFKSISSSVLSLLYGPTLTSIHDYWKNQSFD